MLTHTFTPQISLRKLICSAVLVCLQICLQACSHLPFSFFNKPLQVEQLLEQKAFYQALDIIDNTASSDPDYNELNAMRATVLSAIDAYEQKTLAATNELTHKGQWAQALTQLDEALTHVPASKPLHTRRKQVETTIKQKLADIELSLAQVRAKTLPAEIVLLQQRQSYSPADTIAANLENRESEAIAARAILVAESQRMIDKKQWDSAREYARLADQLKSGKDTSALLLRIEKSIYSSYKERLEKALEDKDLPLAMRLATDMKINKRDDELLALIQALEQQVAATVRQLTRDGQSAYTNGLLDKAIEMWDQALALDPHNTELKKRLLRARSFQSNYQRFKKN